MQGTLSASLDPLLIRLYTRTWHMMINYVHVLCTVIVEIFIGILIFVGGASYVYLKFEIYIAN